MDGELARAVAERMQVLSTPSRVLILSRLKEGPCAVGELAEAVSMEASAVSHQLRQLRHLGLVVGERRGKQVIYGLHDAHVAELLDQAVFHVEHVRLGARQPVSEQRAAHERSRARRRAWTQPWAGQRLDQTLKGGAARRVSLSLVVLLVTAAAQSAVFALTSSVALLADLIHNFGDALTALPLGVAFVMRSFKAEKLAGYFVVATIFISACVALWQSIERLINPHHLSHLWTLAAAGVIGFVGNEIAAWVRLRAGKRLQSPALVADGYHARTDGLVSLSVVLSAAIVALGLNVADPIIGLIVTIVILRITWQSFQTVRTDPGEPDDPDADAEHVRASMTTGHAHEPGHAHGH